MSKDTLILTVDHWLSKEEQAENAEKLATLHRDRVLADLKLKRITKLLKDGLAALDDEIADISNGVLDGYITQDRKAYLVRCYVNQKRIYYDVETQEILRIDAFTETDKQLSLKVDPGDEDVSVARISNLSIQQFNALQQEREIRKQRNELDKQEELEKVLLEAAESISKKKQAGNEDDEMYQVPSDRRKEAIVRVMPPREELGF
jgi:hypothetical protein